MQNQLVEFFQAYENIAILLSLLLNIIISIFGVIPTVFLTAANIVVFGFWQGTFISFTGEALGAIISFYLYRKGFKAYIDKKVSLRGKLKKLINVKGSEAFILILSLRLFPFVPSGLITFAAAIGSVQLSVFALASSLGKIPALLIEAYSVYQVSNWTEEGKVILLISSIFGILLVAKKITQNNPNPQNNEKI
ncbi:VTT domain-containing protein [Bacillus timonensis]|nr:VTT domain-containing protein [Bacillus timonensis]